MHAIVVLATTTAITTKCKKRKKQISKELGVLHPVNHYGYIRVRERKENNKTGWKRQRMAGWI